MTDDVHAEPAGAGQDPADPLGTGGGGEGQALAHCIVANVAQETNQGEGGLEIRSGIRHFSAGAKVWVLPPQWGDGGENVFVVGRHRGSSGPYVRIVVPRRHLTNFRVRVVYSPALLRALLKPLGQRDKRQPWLADRATAEGFAAQWNETPIEARLVDGRWAPAFFMVSDPPPLEYRFMRETYYLAHFNARRAVYSRQPPPIEISPSVEPPPPAAQP
jgi:hypothetical protein